MTKTYNGLWEKVIGFDSLHAAWLKARKGKRHTLACMRFESRLEENLINLQNRLIWGQYHPAGYRSFSVFEPKHRKITALNDFADRVVQHAIVTVIEPIWECRFISDSYACRAGKGTHAGANRAQHLLRDCLATHGKVCALKADISKFFASINHQTLKRLVRRRIADQSLLAVLDAIIDSYSETGTPGTGIPIGNLTSQLFANIYMDELDQWIKCRRQEKCYARYMDDFVVIHHDKQHLRALLLDIQAFLADRLQLGTNHKTQVFPVSPHNGRGLDFLGYHIWPHKRRIRKAAIARFKRRLKQLKSEYAAGRLAPAQLHQQIQSWLAHARHGDALPAVGKILQQAVFTRSQDHDQHRNDANRTGAAGPCRMGQRRGHPATQAGIR